MFERLLYNFMLIFFQRIICFLQINLDLDQEILASIDFF